MILSLLLPSEEASGERASYRQPTDLIVELVQRNVVVLGPIPLRFLEVLVRGAGPGDVHALAHTPLDHQAPPHRPFHDVIDEPGRADRDQSGQRGSGNRWDLTEGGIDQVREDV